MSTTPTIWANRILGAGEMPPDQLLANPHNWRKHPGLQQDAMSEVLEKVGWVQDVIVNQRTGFLVDGHLRVILAMRHHQPTVPCKFVDLSPEEEQLILTTYDPLAALAGIEALAATYERVALAGPDYQQFAAL